MTVKEAYKVLYYMNYTMKKKPEDKEVDAGYFKFQKTESDGSHHVVVLEDHRWEKAEENFDPIRNPFDIGEWLIFSYTDNQERDYFGRFVETQYPLTLPEMEAFINLCKAFEEEEKKK